MRWSTADLAGTPGACVRGAMVPDVCALVRADHTDLDRALRAMVETGTLAGELAGLLDVFRLALAVHIAAEARMFEQLLADAPGSRALRRLAAQSREEHVGQQRASDALARLRPGDEAWFSHALELRVLVVDHASRAELMQWRLLDHAPRAAARALARVYAIERMRVLGRTSPGAVAREQLANARY